VQSEIKFVHNPCTVRLLVKGISKISYNACPATFSFQDISPRQMMEALQWSNHGRFAVRLDVWRGLFISRYKAVRRIAFPRTRLNMLPSNGVTAALSNIMISSMVLGVSAQTWSFRCLRRGKENPPSILQPRGHTISLRHPVHLPGYAAFNNSRPGALSNYETATSATRLGEYLQVDPVKNFQKITISLSR
jgi:hypothetical protein